MRYYDNDSDEHHERRDPRQYGSDASFDPYGACGALSSRPAAR